MTILETGQCTRLGSTEVSILTLSLQSTVRGDLDPPRHLPCFCAKRKVLMSVIVDAGKAELKSEPILMSHDEDKDQSFSLIACNRSSI